MTVGIGFRVHIGWATWAAVAGGEILDVGTIDVRTAGVEITAPYHAAQKLGWRSDDPAIVEAIAEIEEVVNELVDPVLALLPTAGVVLYTSNAPASKVRYELARIHLGDGNVYRTAIRSAFETRGIPCGRMLEQDARPPQSPRPPGRWRAEEKLAVAAAEHALMRRR